MTSRRTKAGISLVLCSAFLAAACSSKFFKSLSGLNALQQHLSQKYGDKVNVSLHNSRYLSIVFMNSPLNTQEREKREERAQDTARFVALNYEGIKQINQMWISFVASETRFIFVHTSHNLDSFGFDRNGAALRRDPLRDEIVTIPEDVRAPVARFNAARNQTDISVTRIQLEGDMIRGIAMVPHFTVSGDARRVESSTVAPESVVLDFASYAPKAVFAGNTNLEIFCDDRVAAKGLAQLTPTAESGTDETIAQFLSAKISFKLFRTMATARRVRITLGSKRFELSPDDIRAFARMSAYVRGPDEANEQ
jgi:hypothetical protein